MARNEDEMDFRALHASAPGWDDWDKGEHAEAFRNFYTDAILSRSDQVFLESIEQRVPILAIAEPWSIDCQRQLPILARMCAVNPCLDLRILNRDQNPELMNRFLTLGTRSIPVFIFFNQEFMQIGDWHARPQVCNQVFFRAKAAGEMEEGRTAVSQIMDVTRDRLTIEEMKILMDRALSAPGRWQRFFEDALSRLTPMSSEEIPNCLDLESLVDVFHCQDYVEVVMVQDALEMAGIDYNVQMFQDRVWDGLFEVDKGVAVIQVLEQDVREAKEAIDEALGDEEEGDELEEDDFEENFDEEFEEAEFEKGEEENPGDKR